MSENKALAEAALKIADLAVALGVHPLKGCIGWVADHGAIVCQSRDGQRRSSTQSRRANRCQKCDGRRAACASEAEFDMSDPITVWPMFAVIGPGFSGATDSRSEAEAWVAKNKAGAVYVRESGVELAISEADNAELAEARVLALQRELEENKEDQSRSDHPRVIREADPRDDVKPSSIQEKT